MQSLKFILLALSFLALSPIANADTDVGADASQAAHDVKDATVHVVKKTGEVARDVGHGTVHVAKAVGHGTASAAKAVGHGVASAARDVGHASKNAVDAGKDTVHKATE